jgi:type I restriction enzyme R subunit
LELHGTLRDYQRVAVSQVLAAVQADRRRMYLQMATGTGKTITAAGIIAKLWSVGLIRRALFLLDRDALAVQDDEGRVNP